MHHALLLGVGLTFTSVLLFLPVLYMQQTTGLTVTSGSMVLLSLPCALLMMSVFVRKDWLDIWLFPCSHLPALVVIPELSGTRLYQGIEGVSAFAVIMVVAAIYFSVAQGSQSSKPLELERDDESEKPIRFGQLQAATNALAVLILGSFLMGIFMNASDDRLNPTIAALTGLCVLWLVLRRYWYPLFIHPLTTEASRDDLVHDVFTVRSVSRQQVFILLFLVFLTLSMLLVFLGIM